MRMKTPHTTSLMFFLMVCFISAQEELKLWQHQEKPFYKENDLKEFETEVWGTTAVGNIVEPTLTLYKAQGENTGKAVVIIPGGGYELVAMYHEGYELAKILSKNGITAAVLKYRIPNPKSSDEPHKVPLSDGRRALKIIHEKAAALNINTNEIGVVGFSAGSHLATVLGLWKSDDTDENPDFTGLIYGVTNMTEGNRSWLENNLYHRKMTQEEIAQNTLLNLVDENTPQAFLVHALDDNSCQLEETTLYAQKLVDHNILVETHIFPKGGHGFGVGKTADGTDQWVGLFVNWLKNSAF
ncbi:alpha/beta hydrolase [Maribacter algicola]|uniref:Alpha/beta hydrolase n=1 Tax=Meishania litoralis TaxID=3434685 RepID=A0ACC7LHZ8_9FLAO